MFWSIMVFLFSLLFVVIPGFAWWPLAIIVPAAFIGFSWFLNHRDRTFFRTLGKVRQGESICDFARSFDRRQIDPWIIRVVYEEFSTNFPLRADDSFEETLRIHPDELDEIAGGVVERAWRSMDKAEDNPLARKVETVRDLVMFMQYQPKLLPG